MCFKMKRKLEDIEFKDISEYAEALNKFKEPEIISENSKGFTVHADFVIEEYFMYVSKSGRTELEWDKVRPAFLWKLKASINEMKDNSLNEDEEDEKDKEKNERTTEFILGRAKSFEAAPFTFQRLCELICWPDRHYSRLGSFLRAMEKTINVISCVHPNGERIINTDGMDFDNGVVDEEDDIHVENTFMVRVDELEMDKPLLPNESPTGKSPRKQSVHIAVPDSPHFIPQEVLDSKANVDLTDIVTYALPIGPHMPSSKKSPGKADDQME